MLSAELDYQQDVLLSGDRLTAVVSLVIPAGRWVVSATVALGNRGTVAHDVDVWTGANPPPLAFAGPRSVHVTLGPGEVSSVTIGPFVIMAGPGGITGTVVAQRDPSAPGDQVFALADTGVMTRAGATGMLAMGAAG